MSNPSMDPPQLILLDLEMPNGGWLGVLAKVQPLKRRGAAPIVIVITGR